MMKKHKKMTLTYFFQEKCNWKFTEVWSKEEVQSLHKYVKFYTLINHFNTRNVTIMWYNFVILTIFSRYRKYRKLLFEVIIPVVIHRLRIPVRSRLSDRNHLIFKTTKLNKFKPTRTSPSEIFRMKQNRIGKIFRNCFFIDE